MAVEHTVLSADARYPARLRERLGEAAPAQLTTLGNLDLLAFPKTGLFCSARCPGAAILRAYDQAAHWRDSGRCIISGFHSPVEKECLRILLRGTSPVIICPARDMPQRLPPEWHEPLTSHRMLVLSFFPAGMSRVTAELAKQRNEFVAALADELWFAHVAPGGQTAALATAQTLTQPGPS
jgi:predicted Rossmann fold nucleotide-binding protein DprA/Smf involved in DNA uptake